MDNSPREIIYHPSEKRMLLKSIKKEYDYVIDTFSIYQGHLLRKTTPWELDNYWKNDNIELQKFKFDIDKVDCIYYAEVEYEGPWKIAYKLIARQKIEENTYIYLELIAPGDYCFFAVGIFFFSRDVNFFMNLVLPKYYQKINKNLIYDSLQKDGIYIDIDSPRRLIDFCFEILYKKQETINDDDDDDLPKLIRNDFDQFVKMKAVKDNYNEAHDYLRSYFNMFIF